MHEQPSPDSANDECFASVWAVVADVPGWLTEDQGRLLWDQARQLGPGASVLEIGSHQGRSTILLGSAVADRSGTVTAVDPFVEGRLFGGRSTRSAFESHIAAAGLTERVHLIPDYSTRLRSRWTEPIDLLYVDGKHDYWTCSDDLRWSSHLPQGGSVLVHDAFSSIGVTSAILLRVLPSRDLAYVGRVGSLALLRRQRPSLADRGRILRELPWWVRNIAVKILLRLRLKPLARALGHSGDYDPY